MRTRGRLWLLVVAAAYFAQTKEVFFAIGIVAGSSLGASQSASRSLMAMLTPKEREAEFFGFYNIFGKFAAIIGPFLVAISTHMTGNPRLGIFSIMLLFVAGGFLLLETRQSEINI